ncbi:response regulator [Runella rosea]|uniref:Response regulator n=1 Tax=Runella rosea TaxID=2259595 RepID=A0A344TH42_9BACT|nr:response regulator [Runella rosea]AXE17963.1 response regulator [Runella rosea]
MTPLPLRLLLADDDADDRLFFREALDQIPVAVELTTVTNGQQLIEWLQEHQGDLPHLIFLDLNMPRKNGHECLTEIKLMPQWQSLPIIIFSTSIYPVQVDELYHKGAQYYIQKPTDFKKLTRVIEQLLLMSEEQRQVQPAKKDFILCRER